MTSTVQNIRRTCFWDSFRFCFTIFIHLRLPKPITLTRIFVWLSPADVCDHLSEELSIVRIGEVAGMSESRFSHVFKEETGISFMEYVGMVRMEKARELLQNTDLRINEIDQPSKRL